MVNLSGFLQSVGSFLVIFAALSWVCGKIVEMWHVARNRHGSRLHAELARCFGESTPGRFTNYFYWHPLVEPLCEPAVWPLRRGKQPDADREAPLVQIYPERHLPGHIAPETFASVMLDPFPWPTLPENLARMLDANRRPDAPATTPEEAIELAKSLLKRRREVGAETRWGSFLGPAAARYDEEFAETPVAVHAVSGWGDSAAEDPMTRLKQTWSQNQIVPDRLRPRMLALIREAEGDVDQLRGAVARWYREMMDRASGRFQRESMAKVFVVAMVVCLLLNVNMLSIGDVLLEQLREGRGNLTNADPAVFRLTVGGNYQGDLEAAYMVAGSLIAAALAAVGAPFWYDILDKVSRRSGRGPSPKSST